MFADNTTFHTGNRAGATAERTDRLAELVHQLGDVPLPDARRAVEHADVLGDLQDPLAVVAGALVQLRHEARVRCLSI